ncbi:MAG: hypothetical protein QG608_939 [Actinomycetota bacterium]|nr:hypothetical protein [Actinomycetota bacterium]
MTEQHTAAVRETAAQETAVRELAVPQVALVLLVGVSGSGKSTFARRHFGRFEVISSDFCRGLVADDENDQSATATAFGLLHHIVGLRLAAHRLTVVDATNVQRESRAGLVALAREHDVLCVAIVLDLPEHVCRERNASRTDRTFGPQVIRRQRDQLRRSLPSLKREGFRRVHVLKDLAEVEAVRIVRDRLLTDLRHETGPFDVIGDVHGCLTELEQLLEKLGHRIVRDQAGRAVDAAHPEGRRVVFLGDLVDRGPDSPGVLRLAMGMVGAGRAFAVPGNHEAKLVRALRGRNVQIRHGLAQTLEQLAAEPKEFGEQVERFCDALVSHLVLDDGRLVVAHAGLKQAYQGRASGRVRSFALYGDTTGETDEYGMPVRYPWAQEYRGTATVLYGHTPVPSPEWVNNTLCVDTGCVFGGRLTACRYPERELVSVPAERVWYEPVRPFPRAEGDDRTDAERTGEAETNSAPQGTATGIGRREPDVLDLTDVVGRRVIETSHHGRITVRAEHAAGALEVMSRFALPPQWLLYLPPTMAPCATSCLPDMLEHPSEAFDAYRADGVREVICQEKHMGSRAVVLVCRDADVAAARFGVTDGSTGAVHTRTGRPFLAPEPTEELLGRVRAAVTAAGLFDELGSGWLLLDCELLPWSAKAEELLRHQYAAVGAAARAVFPAALAALETADSTGLDVAELLARTRDRAGNAESFAAAYRRYCWPVDGLHGVELAPFQVLACEGRTFHDRDHGWHLAVADRLVEADRPAEADRTAGADRPAEAVPGLFRRTARRVLDVTDPAQVDEATGWWHHLTDGGGEGMVVKPYANLARGRRGLIQPGIKVRGREYLRIIYGPDYTAPANLKRLRNRGLGRKRSLALREYALGLQALERAAAAEPLWRVHEAVFAVLALESEPVDPRL